MNTKILFFLSTIFIISSPPLYASDFKCSNWIKAPMNTCIFAQRAASIYKRQCENPCVRRRQGSRRGDNLGPNCDREKVCHPKNPKDFIGVCSKWVQIHGTTCYSRATQDWENKWVRECRVGLRTLWCRDGNPNEL